MAGHSRCSSLKRGRSWPWRGGVHAPGRPRRSRGRNRPVPLGSGAGSRRRAGSGRREGPDRTGSGCRGCFGCGISSRRARRRGLLRGRRMVRAVREDVAGRDRYRARHKSPCARAPRQCSGALFTEQRGRGPTCPHRLDRRPRRSSRRSCLLRGPGRAPPSRRDGTSSGSRRRCSS